MFFVINDNKEIYECTNQGDVKKLITEEHILKSLDNLFRKTFNKSVFENQKIQKIIYSECGNEWMYDNDIIDKDVRDFIFSNKDVKHIFELYVFLIRSRNIKNALMYLKIII